jgi:hypothetical protein
MKKLTYTLIAMFALLLTAAPSFAQNKVFRADVPFSFTIGDQAFPAGNYQFERLLGRPQPGDVIGMVALRNIEAHIYKVVVTSLAATTQGQPGSRLVLCRSGSRHYLAALWASGDEMGQQIAQNSTQAASASDAGEEISLAKLR